MLRYQNFHYTSTAPGVKFFKVDLKKVVGIVFNCSALSDLAGLGSVKRGTSFSLLPQNLEHQNLIFTLSHNARHLILPGFVESNHNDEEFYVVIYSSGVHGISITVIGV